MSDTVYTIKIAIQKIEHFCAYQERCHDEVMNKLRAMKIESNEIDEIMAHLISANFLNETRFACSFARGKHRIKNWGIIRITNELKQRNISSYNITAALKEISVDEYESSFNALAERHWENMTERNSLKKRKKFCDYLLRKGYESDIVYAKAKELEKN